MSELLPSYEQQARETFILNRASYVEPASVDFRHILIRDYRPEARQKAEHVLEAVRAGGDFEAIAMEYSDDPSVVQNGGALVSVDSGTLDEQFSSGLLSLEPGEPAVVESQFGFHVAILDEQRPGGPLEFADIKTQLVEQARENHYNRIFDRLMRQALEGELVLESGAVAEIFDRYPPIQELVDDAAGTAVP